MPSAMETSARSHSSGPCSRRASLTLARPTGRCALVSLIVLLSCGRALRAGSLPAERRFVATWAGGPRSPAGRLAAPSSNAPPRRQGTIVHHGSRSVAATVVLVEQSRQINLSRLGGLQGP